MQSLNKMFLLFIYFVSFIFSYNVYKLNVHFYFDPISEEPCNHTNYWTPFYQNTTCFRFMNLRENDTEDNQYVEVILDHNIANDTFDNVNTVLKQTRILWKRYNGALYAPDEDLMSGLFKNTEKPTPGKIINPTYPAAEYFMNSNFMINEVNTIYNGYWTNTSYDDTNAYAITSVGRNEVLSKSIKRGIRPVLKLEKTVVNVIPDIIDIDDLLTKESKLIKYEHDRTKYETYAYKQLQGFSICDDKLVFVTSNGSNPTKGVIYSYEGNNFENLDKKLYTDCGHGNAATCNSDTNSIFITQDLGNKQVNEYSNDDFTLLHEYKIADGHEQFHGMSYDPKHKYFVGSVSRRCFVTTSGEKLKKLQQFDYGGFELYQGPEFIEDLIYVSTFSGGVRKDQPYDFIGKGNNLIYVYGGKMDENGKPDKNFGRLIARLFMGKHGELEGIYAHNGKIYIGYAAVSIDPLYVFQFYECDYTKFINRFIEYIPKENLKVLDN